MLTNDDGIEAPGFRLLVKALHTRGYPLVVLAPKTNHSATGMRIKLMEPMGLRSRQDLAPVWELDEHVCPVHLFELDGTPCDTMIVALDGGLNHLVPGVVPQMVVSGVNLGPNLSQDSYHSGTMGAAREAGLYGVPAIATSFTSFELLIPFLILNQLSFNVWQLLAGLQGTWLGLLLDTLLGKLHEQHS